MRYLPSLTMPTISRGVPSARGPMKKRLPKGSCPGQKRCAIVSLMTATLGDSFLSASLKSRPRKRWMPREAKYFGLTALKSVSNDLLPLGGSCPSTLMPSSMFEPFNGTLRARLADSTPGIELMRSINCW